MFHNFIHGKSSLPSALNLRLRRFGLAPTYPKTITPGDSNHPSKSLAKSTSITLIFCQISPSGLPTTQTAHGLGSPARFPLSEEALAMTNAAARRMSMFSSELTILSNGPVECHGNQLDMDHEAVNGPTNGVCL
jgi:hypothetical protein